MSGNGESSRSAQKHNHKEDLDPLEFLRRQYGVQLAEDQQHGRDRGNNPNTKGKQPVYPTLRPPAEPSGSVPAPVPRERAGLRRYPQPQVAPPHLDKQPRAVENHARQPDQDNATSREQPTLRASQDGPPQQQMSRTRTHGGESSQHSHRPSTHHKLIHRGLPQENTRMTKRGTAEESAKRTGIDYQRTKPTSSIPEEAVPIHSRPWLGPGPSPPASPSIPTSILSALTNARWMKWVAAIFKWIAIIAIVACVWRFFNLVETMGSDIEAGVMSTISTIVGVISALSTPRPDPAPALAQWSLIPAVPHIEGLVIGLEMIQHDVDVILEEGVVAPEFTSISIPVEAAKQVKKDLEHLDASIGESLDTARYQLSYLIELAKLDPASHIEASWLDYLDSLIGYSHRRSIMVSRCTSLVRTLAAMQTSRQKIQHNIKARYQGPMEKLSTEICQASERLEERKSDMKGNLTSSQVLSGAQLPSLYQYVSETSAATENFCKMIKFDARWLKQLVERMGTEIKEIASSEYGAKQVCEKLKGRQEVLSEKVIDSIERGSIEIAIKELDRIRVYYNTTGHP